jgi:hypothetical protein
VLREQPTFRAISRMPILRLANTLISTVCSKVINGGQKATILARAGQIYLGAAGQFCFGVNN